jgi:formylglycine-generating enzyme required for sulfatase activity
MEGETGIATPVHSATVSPFLLDAYEITVGRFRKFVDAYPSSKPKAGAGAHPLIANSGWNSSWDSSLPSDAVALRSALVCDSLSNPIAATWTDTPGANETLPINCLSWYDLFAFCAWDGGRIPTEAEWEYAARGGAEEREYPWGNAPVPDPSLAIFGAAAPAPVGSVPMGDSKWKHHDLAGNVWEWTIDWYAGYSAGACNDCANLTPANWRVNRGGSFSDGAGNLRAATRHPIGPSLRYPNIGGRCAKSL